MSKPESNASARARNQRKRLQVLGHLGGVCKGCGFTDPRALQIDHVAGGGVRELRSMSRHNYLKKVMNDTSGTYQLLCANCNWIKRTVCNENPGSGTTTLIASTMAQSLTTANLTIPLRPVVLQRCLLIREQSHRPEVGELSFEERLTPLFKAN